MDEIIFHAYHSVGMETVGMLMVGMEIDFMEKHSPCLLSTYLLSSIFGRYGDCFFFEIGSMPTVSIPTVVGMETVGMEIGNPAF